MMRYFVGAYATAPITESWDPAVQGEYLQGLKAMPNVRGLEHPFTGTLHQEDDDWFLANIDPDWDFVFTGLPGVMQRLGNDASFGLASTDEAGRQAALEFYQQARQAILKLNRHLGRKAVTALLVHAAPRVTSEIGPDGTALTKSLQTLASRDWDGATLVLEHCDAQVPGQSADKGFMHIETEIEAVTTVNREASNPIGLCINWGRSALEARSVDGPVAHLQAARDAGLLRGLMFSGVSGQESAYGAWRDTHMPPAQAFDIPAFEPCSLLTETEFRRCLQVADADALDFMGVKISVRPDALSVDERLAYIAGALHILDQING
ncbi:hypothetical protein AUP74_03288 [Microbulbifer aggregans]|uniref:DUF4862 domain-containing protein n=1 Tax=Microbulbifer aggregans TaxID=1769779 RepID=A0A1C9WBY6_9GAMM|nr:DUF4862 family protein [Microbulbifer aggregans]AOS98654.1 hypothetical protein AUP74_03288 [Microbulbifer aggregans]